MQAKPKVRAAPLSMRGQELADPDCFWPQPAGSSVARVPSEAAVPSLHVDQPSGLTDATPQTLPEASGGELLLSGGMRSRLLSDRPCVHTLLVQHGTRPEVARYS